jgi:hypothetical protein
MFARETSMTWKLKIEGRSCDHSRQDIDGIRAAVARLTQRFEDQKQDLEFLAEALIRVEDEKEQLASRLGEAEGELAKTRATVREKDERLKLAKAENEAMQATITAARAALEPVHFAEPETAALAWNIAAANESPDHDETREAPEPAAGIKIGETSITERADASLISGAIFMRLTFDPEELATLDELALACGHNRREALVEEMVRRELLSRKVTGTRSANGAVQDRCLQRKAIEPPGASNAAIT